MTILSTRRSGLDSFIYWATFITLACFVTFFLNTMVELASAEEHQYDNSMQIDATMVHAHSKSHHATSSIDNSDSPDIPVDDVGVE